MITTLLMISLAIAALYIAVAIKQLGQWPQSFADLFTLPSPAMKGFAFLAVSLGAILAAPAGIERASADTKFLVFLTIGATMAFGIAALKGDECKPDISTLLGYLAFVGCFLLVMLNSSWWLLLLWVPLLWLDITGRIGCWRLVASLASIVQYYLFCLL